MEHIPSEVLIHVFSFLSRRHELACVSLVCRRWNTLAFAELYHTLFLGRQTHVDSVSERILSESENETSLRISSVLQRLIFDPIPYKGIEEASSLPEEVVCKLVYLKHLSWEFLETPRPRIMIAFRDHCPDLQTVDLRIRLDLFPRRDEWDAPNVFCFQGLRGLSLEINIDGYSSTLRNRLPQPVSEMIEASPNLYALNLAVYSRPPWNMASWFNESMPLGSVRTFPNLRIYRAEGDIKLNWASFFETPETNGFHSFLQLHPFLHTVTLNWNAWDTWHDNIDPNELARLFPSLRHFEGPLFLCEALLQSSLAVHLETLGILDEWLDVTDNALTRVADKIACLPELRTLVYMPGHHPIGDAKLAVLLAATPRLKHLSLRGVSHVRYQLLQHSLKQTPNLQILTMPFPGLHDQFPNRDRLETMAERIRPLAIICPQLEYLYDTAVTLGRTCWKIIRERGKVVNLDFDRWARDTPRYWEDD